MKIYYYFTKNYVYDIKYVNATRLKDCISFWCEMNAE